ncbi:alpha/beta hydrolase [Candidatus Halobonum tyrrellensis]|uniref:Esterase/lipase-like protein n=1 Tax=Candidatus Halobonum tyrrellensis G22 TaxID=1324957 RepID=V4J3V3_9EURY|nr:alpha/beta hydrolase [Candidatus Halobonum tyrrellensis]ESP90057.1 Esterase/lipase-like protein [Candidatus Halobonum tyrrellensis G22]
MAPPTDDADASDESGGDPVAVFEGVTYADREAGAMDLDLFVPETDDPPLVVYVHGGGWVAETRDNVPDPERYAAELGCALASVSYRLAEVPDDADEAVAAMFDSDNPTPRGVFPDPFVDVKASIRWLRSNADEYGYDADRVAAWGSSAGGHLALLAGVVDDVADLDGTAFPDADLEKTVAPDESGAVQAVVDWYGVADFALVPGDATDPTSLLLGGTKSDREAAFAEASPLTHVAADSPPMLVMHGTEDDVVPVEHSRRLFDALDDRRVDAAFYELHHLDHVWSHDGVEAIESERTAMDLLTAEPTPAQSLRRATHAAEGESGTPLVEGAPPAGPVPIREFLDRTIR